MKYSEIRDVASRAFREGVERRGLNERQAFAFAYEHLGVLIEGEDAWSRLLALTAAFKAGAEANVKLAGDSPFTEDVLNVLRASYLREAPSELERHRGSMGDEGLQGDMEYVTATFLHGS